MCSALPDRVLYPIPNRFGARSVLHVCHNGYVVTTYRELNTYAEDRSDIVKRLRGLANSEGTVAAETIRLMNILLPHMDREDRLIGPLWSNLFHVATENIDIIRGLSRFQGEMKRQYSSLESDHLEIQDGVMHVRRAAVLEGNREALKLLDRLSAIMFIERAVVFPMVLLGYNHAKLLAESSDN